MTSHYSLPPTDWNTLDRRNPGAVGFRATSPRLSTPPPRAAGGVTFYSPLSRWDVSHNESTGSRGTCGFASGSDRSSYIPASQGGSGCVAPLESWIRGHHAASAAFRSTTPRHSYITAPVLHRGPSPRSGGAPGVRDEPRGAPLSNAPMATWVKEPGRRSSSFAPSTKSQRHSYIPASTALPSSRGSTSNNSQEQTNSTGVTSYAAMDDWGRSKVRGRPTAGMMSKSPRHSYIPKS